VDLSNYSAVNNPHCFYLYYEDKLINNYCKCCTAIFPLNREKRINLSTTDVTLIFAPISPLDQFRMTIPGSANTDVEMVFVSRCAVKKHCCILLLSANIMEMNKLQLWTFVINSDRYLYRVPTSRPRVHHKEISLFFGACKRNQKVSKYKSFLHLRHRTVLAKVLCSWTVHPLC